MTLNPEQVKLLKEAAEDSVKQVSSVIRVGGIGPHVKAMLELRHASLLTLSLQLDQHNFVTLSETES